MKIEMFKIERWDDVLKMMEKKFARVKSRLDPFYELAAHVRFCEGLGEEVPPSLLDCEPGPLIE
jgi:hypothetical protein